MRSLGAVRSVSVEFVTAARRSPFQYSRRCRRAHFTAYARDDDRRADDILNILDKGGIDIILPIGIMGARLVAKHRHRFPARTACIPMPDIAALEVANNKIEVLKIARQCGACTPPSWIYPDDASNADLTRVRFPVLVKAPDLGGGEGFHLFNDAQSLDAYLNKAVGPLLVQSYIDGTMWGLNVICRNGEILVHTVQQNFDHENGEYSPPAAIKIVEDDHVFDEGRKVLEALKYTGVANLDFIRCSATGKTMLLEINPRFWRTCAGSVLAGVNFPYFACCEALGLPWGASRPRPIIYANARAAWNQISLGRGEGALAGFSVRNSVLWANALDPMPSIIGRINRNRG